MKWKFIIVYHWLADGEGGGRTARVSLETPNTTFNQILLQGETLNQPLLYTLIQLAVCASPCNIFLLGY